MWSQFRDKTDKPKVGMASHQHTDFDGVLGDYFGGAALDGHITGSGGKRLAELAIQAGNARLRGEEVIDGKSCHVVEADNPRYGKITLWMAEEGGEVLMLKARFVKGASHIFRDDKPLSAQELDLYEGVIDKVKFSRVGEAAVPISGRYTLTSAGQLTNNRKVITECTYTRTEIVLNPSFEGTDAFVIDLPNGAFVSNLDDRESGVAYVWHNGKMVPASDYEAPEATWTWGQSQGRLIAALVISGALLGAGAWLWLKRRKRPEANTPSRPSR